MESRRLVYVPFGAHGTARAEDWRLVGRVDITVQFHPPRVWLFEFLGRSAAAQAASRTYIPASLFRLASKSTTSIITAQGTFLLALHWSVEATCMLERGLTSLGLTLSQNKSVVVASHSSSYGPFGVTCWSKGLSFEGAPSVRDVGLDANAAHRRSVKISKQEGAKVPQKKRPHQGDTQRVEVQTPDNEVVQNRDPASRGHPAQKGDGCRLMWQENQGRMHYNMMLRNLCFRKVSILNLSFLFLLDSSDGKGRIKTARCSDVDCLSVCTWCSSG